MNGTRKWFVFIMGNKKAGSSLMLQTGLFPFGGGRGRKSFCLALFILLFAVLPSVGQNVLDRAYYKQTSPVRAPDFNHPSFLLKAVHFPNLPLISALCFYEHSYRNEPLHIDGCTYFYPNQMSNPLYIDTIPKGYFVPTNKDTIIHMNGQTEIKSFPTDTDLIKRRYENDIYRGDSYITSVSSFFRYYADTSLTDSMGLRFNQKQDPFFYVFGCKKSFAEFYHPFYFKNTEVTNADYREFTNWVRDSIARTLLALNGFKAYAFDTGVWKPGMRLNWVTPINWQSDDPDYNTALLPLFIPEGKRFYKRVEINTAMLIYTYKPLGYERTLTPSERARGDIRILSYPDTGSWMHDFSYSFNEPMTNMYFWHPAYDNYPVVGISRIQAEAFLHWKTVRMQQKLDAEHKNYTIEYDLPAEYQWEMAGSATKNPEGKLILNRHSNYFQGESFLTDLQLANADTICQSLTIYGPGWKETQEYMSRYKMALENSLHPRNYFIGDGYFHTAPADYKQAVEDMKHRKKEKPDVRTDLNEKNALSVFSVNQDPNGICFMGGNVSEWVKETYKDNWLPIYTKRHELLKKLKGKDIVMLLALEDYYNSLCDTNGVLVRGANWYDERYNNINGKNTVGMMAKTFANPESAFSTVGFRYIVRVKRKDEDAVLKKK
jgi:formylglycine-generating enzyme required for sulfatase activity